MVIKSIAMLSSSIDVRKVSVQNINNLPFLNVFLTIFFNQQVFLTKVEQIMKSEKIMNYAFFFRSQ